MQLNVKARSGQIALTLVVTALLLLLAFFALERVEQTQLGRGIEGGFGFLSQPAGFRISESLIRVSPADSYWMAILAGLLNTVYVAAVSLAGASVLGFLLGLLRLSPNPLVQTLSNWVVEPIRNTPLVLQLFVWYGLFLQLPHIQEAWAPLPGVTLSNRGLFLPSFQGLLPYLLVLALGLYALVRLKSTVLKGLTLAAVILLCVWFDPIVIEHTTRRGLGFSGGWQLSIEFSALCLGLIVFHASYISDIVRGSIRSVPLGVVEAGRSLALSRARIVTKIIVPCAFRNALPAYANQCLAMVKNSSLAIVIGFQDLMAIINTAITQTGLALEGVAIAAGFYLSIAALFAGVFIYLHARNHRYQMTAFSLRTYGSSLTSGQFSRQALFGTFPRAIATTICGFLMAAGLIQIADWALFSAVWHGGVQACQNATGACWSAVVANMPLLAFGTMDAEHYGRAIFASAVVVSCTIFALVFVWPENLRVAVFAAGVLVVSVILSGFPFGWKPIAPLEWGGLLMTLILAVLAILVAIPIALALALARRSSQVWLSMPATALIEAVRGIPLVTQLLFVSFVLPLVVGSHDVVPKFALALIALSLHTACLLAEVVRGALDSVPGGQSEAAKALGMRPHQTFFKVILPQARKIATPAALGIFVGAVKDTSLVMVIGIFDVLSASKAVVAQPVWRPYFIEIYLFVALIYFLICFGLSRVAKGMEQRAAT